VVGCSEDGETLESVCYNLLALWDTYYIV